MSLLGALDFPVLCPFRICTGHACMGCGLTRSVIALFRGDLDLSLRYHPLGVALVAQAMVIAVAVGAVWLTRPDQVTHQRMTPSELLAKSQVLIWANVALLGAVWVVRWRLGLLDFVVAS